MGDWTTGWPCGRRVGVRIFGRRGGSAAVIAAFLAAEPAGSTNRMATITAAARQQNAQSDGTRHEEPIAAGGARRGQRFRGASVPPSRQAAAGFRIGRHVCRCAAPPDFRTGWTWPVQRLEGERRFVAAGGGGERWAAGPPTKRGLGGPLAAGTGGSICAGVKLRRRLHLRG